MTREELITYLGEIAPGVASECGICCNGADCVAWDSRCKEIGCAIIQEAIDLLKRPSAE